LEAELAAGTGGVPLDHPRPDCFFAFVTRAFIAVSGPNRR
jgi:hypothetical protein